MEKVRSKLRQEFESTESEEKRLEEYKQEMELLLQEKMAHVEELRLIHADINLVRTMSVHSKCQINEIYLNCNMLHHIP